MDEYVSLKLFGRIDSNNASSVEAELFSALEGKDSLAVELDAEKLEYISSAGLRILLRIRKNRPGMRIVNVSPEVYDILDMTGFTDYKHFNTVFKRYTGTAPSEFIN